MLRHLPALCAALCALSAAPAQGATPPLPEHAGALRYELKFLGAVVARPEVRLGAVSVTEDGQRVRSATVDSKTRGVLKRIYDVDSRMDGVLDAHTHAPLRSYVRRKIGDVEHRTRFRWHGDSVAVDRTTDKGRDRKTVNIEPGTQDVVSWILWLRGLSLKEGQTASTSMYTGRSYLTLTARADGEEQVKVSAGTFRARRITCELFRRPLPSDEGATVDEPVALNEIIVWLSPQQHHLPVKMKISLGILATLILDLSDARFPSR